MNLYLSRIELNLADRAARRDLSDIGQLHRTLMACYDHTDGDADARAHVDLLYRIESGRTGVRIISQATKTPDLSRLQPGYAKASQVKDVTALTEAASHPVGARYRYRIDAYPSASINFPNLGVRVNRKPVTGAEERLAWWERRSLRHGFTLDQLPAVDGLERRQDRSKAQPAVVIPARFEGVLLVTDPELFTAALVSGIGPAKAYGCGLLTLARL